MSISAVGSAQRANPLTIDLALSIVALAALKARQGRRPMDDARAAAAKLRDYFKSNLDELRGQPARAGTVRPDELRRGLEEALATLAPVATRFQLKDPLLLSELTQLLEEFLSDHGIKRADAVRLLQALHHVETSLEIAPSVPDLSALEIVGRRDGV